VTDPRIEAELERFRAPRGRLQPMRELDPIRRALEAMGDPQHRLPPVIHVTGTNGKGSTTAFLRCMAEACGLRAHVFTSPHLIAVNERIRVAGRIVEDEMLYESLCEVSDRTEGMELTYFEALTATAMDLFARNPADLAVIEVGAGGATDATNVFARPLATVVTPISRDHEDLFGVSGVAGIARVKSGIFREGAPAIITAQPPLAMGVLTEEARKAGSPVLASGRSWKARWEGDAFVFAGARLRVRAPWLGLAGRHQAENAGAACAALEQLAHRRVTPEGMADGLRQTTWPGRLQGLAPGPLTRDLDGGIILDAAHNPGGAASLAAAIRSATPEEGDRVALVFAVQGRKDIGGILAELAPAVRDVIACPLPDSGGQEGGPGADPHHIADIARALGAHVMIATDALDGIRLAKASGAQRIYVAGSVYLCGAVLRANGQTVE
jgi:dihydrofolate synthase / folylpolyglutamate synthase